MSDDIRSEQYKIDRLHIGGKKPSWFQDEYFEPEKMWTCKECNSENDEMHTYCQYCGDE